MGEVATDLPPVRIVSAREECTFIAKNHGREYIIEILRWGVRGDGPWEWWVAPVQGSREIWGDTVGSLQDVLTAAREAIVETYS